MSICLVAFDFGTTTVKAVIASAELSRNAVTGRSELRSASQYFRPEPIFTPYVDGHKPSGQSQSGLIDITRLEEIVNAWLKEGLLRHANPSAILAGGVIVTGLAAKSENAKRVAESVRARLGEAVVAIADEPGQESWLAFMGSTGPLSAVYPEQFFLNFDIGGGTTNLATGRDRSVYGTGSLWIGGRHFEFEPGSYHLKNCSDFGKKILQSLKIPCTLNKAMSRSHLEGVVEFYVRQLECVAQGLSGRGKTPKFLWQLPLRGSALTSAPALTFSGGVGEIVYRLLSGEKISQTSFGDIGIDLAQGILASPLLSSDLKRFMPQHRGRATVSGLAFHGVEASGATVYLKDPELLPLRDIPLLGRVSASTSLNEMNRLLARAKKLSGGVALQLDLGSTGEGDLRGLATRLSGALSKNSFAKGKPLIIFLRENLGKTFGHYLTQWGRADLDLLVVDEVDTTRVSHKACFVSVHPSGDKNLLVSFYGGLD